jgi:hypothetical protein
MKSDAVCFGRYIPTFRLNSIISIFGCISHRHVIVSSKKLLHYFRFLKYLEAGTLLLPIYVFNFLYQLSAHCKLQVIVKHVAATCFGLTVMCN